MGEILPSLEHNKSNRLEKWFQRLGLIATLGTLITVPSAETDSNNSSQVQKENNNTMSLTAEALRMHVESDHSIEPVCDPNLLIEAAKQAQHPKLKDFLERFPKESKYFNVTGIKIPPDAKNILVHLKNAHLPTIVSLKSPEGAMSALLHIERLNFELKNATEEIQEATGAEIKGIMVEEVSVEDEEYGNDIIRTNPTETLTGHYEKFGKKLFGGTLPPDHQNIFYLSHPIGCQLAMEKNTRIFGTTTDTDVDYYRPKYDEIGRDDEISPEERMECDRLNEYREERLVEIANTNLTENSGAIMFIEYAKGHNLQDKWDSHLPATKSLGLIEITSRTVKKEQKP